MCFMESPPNHYGQCPHRFACIITQANGYFNYLLRFFFVFLPKIPAMAPPHRQAHKIVGSRSNEGASSNKSVPSPSSMKNKTAPVPIPRGNASSRRRRMDTTDPIKLPATHTATTARSILVWFNHPPDTAAEQAKSKIRAVVRANTLPFRRELIHSIHPFPCSSCRFPLFFIEKPSLPVLSSSKESYAGRGLNMMFPDKISVLIRLRWPECPCWQWPTWSLPDGRGQHRTRSQWCSP